jgi:hypothetical protein
MLAGCYQGWSGTPTLTGFQKRSAVLFNASDTHMTGELLEWQMVLTLLSNPYRSYFVTSPIFSSEQQIRGV